VSVILSSQPAAVFAHRRAALIAALPPTADDAALPGEVLVVAGDLRGRNYPANYLPYRADSHFLYLTGAAIPGAALRLSEGRALLYAHPPSDDDALWHGPSPELAAIAAATGVDEVRPLAQLEPDLAAADRATLATLPSSDPQTRAWQAATLGREWPATRAPSLAECTAHDRALADALIALRLRHDDAAIAQIRRAVEATVAAHRAGMAATRPGRNERDVRAAMERELTAYGAAPAYGPIVTVRGEVLHNDRAEHPLRPGDLLLADVGGEHEGWASDVTRTWPVSGRFSATQRAIYDVVLQAELDAIAAVAPGVRYREVHLTAARTLTRGLVDLGILRGEVDGLLAQGAHALFFPHGVGHLLGLDVHDMEDLGDRAGYAPGRARAAEFGLRYLRLDRDLEPGMVVTIEPGFYQVPAILGASALVDPLVASGALDRERLAAFADVRGIRIEDDVCVTPHGREVLTAAIPKLAGDIEAAVGHAPG
jgi:Xaa-Pro aminopeptidase